MASFGFRLRAFSNCVGFSGERASIQRAVATCLGVLVWTNEPGKGIFKLCCTHAPLNESWALNQ